MRNPEPILSGLAQRRVSLLLSVSLLWCAAAYGLSSGQAAEIDKLMRMLYQRGQFNGAILVAKHRKIVYRKAFENCVARVKHVSRSSSDPFGLG